MMLSHPLLYDLDYDVYDDNSYPYPHHHPYSHDRALANAEAKWQQHEAEMEHQHYNRLKVLEEQQKCRQLQECFRTLRQRQFEEEEYRRLYEAALTRRLEAEASLKRFSQKKDHDKKEYEEETAHERGPGGNLYSVSFDNPSKQRTAVPGDDRERIPALRERARQSPETNKPTWLADYEVHNEALPSRAQRNTLRGDMAEEKPTGTNGLMRGPDGRLYLVEIPQSKRQNCHLYNKGGTLPEAYEENVASLLKAANPLKATTAYPKVAEDDSRWERFGVAVNKPHQTENGNVEEPAFGLEIGPDGRFQRILSPKTKQPTSNSQIPLDAIQADWNKFLEMLGLVEKYEQEATNTERRKTVLQTGDALQRRQEVRYDTIPQGTVVSLKGLVNRPERNGGRGTVQQYDPSSGRYTVVLEDAPGERIRIKPANLLQHVNVKLHGLESKPEWNGQRGTIVAWDAGTERYNLYIRPLSKVIGLKPSNVVLENGTVGRITGLQSKPELNGKWGTIKSFNRDSGRYDVQLSTNQILRLKMENIRV